jgi:hypothetical protein
MKSDEELQKWREATEKLVPPAALLERLAAAVEASAPAPTVPQRAPGVPVAVKVLFVAMVLGAVGYAVFTQRTTTWWARSRSVEPVAQAQAQADASGLNALVRPACPQFLLEARPSSARAAPGPREREIEQARSRAIVAAQAHLKTRPLTCTGQWMPINTLLYPGGATGAEFARLTARKAFLCNVGAGQRFDQPLGRCDNSDWCHVPPCDRSSEACTRLLAARPVQTCTGQEARRELIEKLCLRRVRGALSKAQAQTEIRALLEALRAELLTERIPDPWCLDPAVEREVAFLRGRGATPGTPPANLTVY